jgi:hypothetical protein
MASLLIGKILPMSLIVLNTVRVEYPQIPIGLAAAGGCCVRGMGIANPLAEHRRTHCLSREETQARQSALVCELNKN